MKIDWYKRAIDSLGWKEITMWWDSHGTFNHIEDGHNSGDEPTPNCDYQKKSWKGRKWSKAITYMHDNKVMWP